MRGDVIIIILLSQFMTSFSVNDELMENIQLAQCRRSCLLQFTEKCKGSRDECCKSNMDCYVCWSSCRLFQGNHPTKSTLCTDQTACYPGCKAVCRFYDKFQLHDLPSLLPDRGNLPASMASPVLRPSGRLSWDAPKWRSRSQKSLDPDLEIIVYLVMVKINGIWSQHIQTSTTQTIIPAWLENKSFRLLAVSANGVVADERFPASFHATERPSGLVHDPSRLVSETEDHHQTVTDPEYLDETTSSPLLSRPSQFHSHSNVSESRNFDSNVYQKDQDVVQPSVSVDVSWKIELDLKSGGRLALVELKWAARGDGSQEYMVVWSEFSGGIAGHLLTKQRSAEVSLWSQQKYRIRVELLGTQGNSILQSSTRIIHFIKGGTDINVSEFSSETVKYTNLNVTKSRRPVPKVTTARLKSSDASDYKYVQYFTTEASINRSSYFISKTEIPNHSKRYLKSNYSTSFLVHSFINSESLHSSHRSKLNATLYKSDIRKNVKLNTISENKSYHTVWLLSLVISALIILVLIVFAILTLRKSSVFHQSNNANQSASEFMFDTTISTVNTTAPSISSHVSKNHCEDGAIMLSETRYVVSNYHNDSKVINVPQNPTNPDGFLSSCNALGNILDHPISWVCEHNKQVSYPIHSPCALHSNHRLVSDHSNHRMASDHSNHRLASNHSDHRMASDHSNHRMASDHSNHRMASDHSNHRMGSDHSNHRMEFLENCSHVLSPSERFGNET